MDHTNFKYILSELTEITILFFYLKRPVIFNQFCASI
jgi:hypothetical protein